MIASVRQPKMVSLWEEFFPEGFDTCDSDIVDVMYPLENEGNLELTFDILTYDEEGKPQKKMRRRLLAKDTYVFDLPQRDFVLNQAIKRVDCYPDIVRIDLVTTGSLLRFECKSYKIETVSDQQ